MILRRQTLWEVRIEDLGCDYGERTTHSVYRQHYSDCEEYLKNYVEERIFSEEDFLEYYEDHDLPYADGEITMEFVNVFFDSDMDISYEILESWQPPDFPRDKRVFYEKVI